MSDAELPRLVVTGGSALTLTCVLMLLFFVHHLSRAIVADTVIQRVGDQLDRAVAAIGMAGSGWSIRASISKASSTPRSTRSARRRRRSPTC